MSNSAKAQNPFSLFGLEPCLVLDEGIVEQRFRELGAEVHPDAQVKAAQTSVDGVNTALDDAGKPVDGDEFARLNEAKAVLISPAKRLRAWLQCEIDGFDQVPGLGKNLVGELDVALMDMFTKLASLLQECDELIGKRERASSMLARAMTEPTAQALRTRIEGALEEVSSMIESAVAKFSQFENEGGEKSLEKALKVQRELSFLEKWELQLRSRFGRLF